MTLQDNVSMRVVDDENLCFEILSFCDEFPTRNNFLFLSKHIFEILTTEKAFKWRLDRLHKEYGVYFPPVLAPKQSWKSLYIEVLPRRYLWDGKKKKRATPEAYHDSNRNKVAVCTRMKPLASTTSDDSTPELGRVTLPLHQRLSLIRMSRNLKSNRDAIQVLKMQGGWFAEKWKEERKATVLAAGNKPEKRPEADDNDEAPPPSLSGGVHAIDPIKSRLFVVDPTKGLREFSFDCVLPSPSSQDETYEKCARQLVCDFINGSNATCLAYGQTGSGKTYTMFGPHDPNQPFMSFDQYSATWGIVPRAIHEVFEAINYRRAKVKVAVDPAISMSYIDIYGENVSDLLRKRAPCGHSKVAAQRYVLSGAAEKKVDSFSDAMDLLNQGEKEKRMASTAMNERSSRAHTILVLTLRQTVAKTRQVKTSRLFLVDLGGSEKLKKSQANSSNQRTKEAVNINLGLLALKKCVEALNSTSTSRKPYVPYADSKLTMLLRAGLGGNSKSCVVICGAQDTSHARETLNALAFGRAVSKVTNTFNRGDEEAMLQHLLAEVDRAIAACEEKIKQNERWETKEEKHHDIYGEIEVRKTSQLVGAESYRLELETLLHRRAQLAGATLDRDGGSPTIGFGNAHEYGMGQKYVSGNE
eukprot:scaffold22620_cov131-Cylindrotheca_fusiformis.AAC.32